MPQRPYVVGDTPLVQITITSGDDGTALDLSHADASATLRWRVNGASVQEEAMTAVNASGGVFKRRWNVGDLSGEGTVLFEVLAIDKDGNRFTSQQFRRDIRRRL